MSHDKIIVLQDVPGSLPPVFFFFFNFMRTMEMRLEHSNIRSLISNHPCRHFAITFNLLVPPPTLFCFRRKKLRKQSGAAKSLIRDPSYFISWVGLVGFEEGGPLKKWLQTQGVRHSNGHLVV